MTRVAFIERWKGKAQRDADPFDRFFAAWIGLVIAARGTLSEEEMAQPDTDRKAMIEFLVSRSTEVQAVLQANPNHIAWLAKRTGAGTGEAILDVPSYAPKHLRRLFDTLAAVWSGSEVRKPNWIANATAEMINHIRNNMFHGGKAPDDVADRELLANVNPILLGLLHRLT